MRVWDEIVERARLYPSPHNSQPIKLRPLDDTSAALYYDLDLGLPAESFGIPFAHVCAGVFLESLAVVAAGLGSTVVESLDTRPMDFGSTDRLHPLGVVRLEPRTVSPEDEERLRVFLARRTSRRPYEDRLVPEHVLAPLTALAAAAGHDFRTTSDPAIVRRVVRVNQATLFSDLENDAVYDEIMTWLRFSRREAAERADGLSAEAMLMPGPLLRFAMGHRGLWHAPVVGAGIRTMYLNTMRGVRQLGWLEGPFGAPADHIEAGRTFMRLWLALAAADVHLHPFGTVITNPGSHRVFADAVSADEGGDRMAWMLFRFGYSSPPPVAHRRPAAAMLLPASA
ncbi:hypothetical protein QDR37_06985 [Amnibacterium sp. CER49]|uniref:hypothetical protein n=1 Tax=Amnibacterium sp. CER49 TaxID=3039161 RepID=UPI00244D6A43|nr:hypothetical protein [Amnibacterium sp. CER49]MDH2443684.1 hypothetical protein [Amnibacterium sp. CER49]